MLIDSPEALGAAVAELAKQDPVMAGLLARGVRPTLRRRDPGFAGLVAIVTAQQVSTASAAAILSRLTAAFDPFTADRVAAAADEDLRALGLSRPKIRTVRALASALAAGDLRLEDLPGLPPEQAEARLTRVPGIGPWTAGIYLKFCLGHPDAFAAGDLALQEAARLAYGLPSRPSAGELLRLAERWRPWRTAAAYMLWTLYRQARSREGVLAPPGAA
ncbi:DNA-3-methyladenine glycosylase 2 family protein [Enterovirga sp.]|uniref:DNA-3-methyladenine glycosylase family protein n=1 Tax=Enterovirga sp. TaxID=2026350 RepID=UPI0026281FD0|nr:DNA-3-methyladenine glycosylase 2 family protein [Enterovirga sp.]MDB5590051.1 DNA-3-methyladenine glycosylase 2 family protein [Enterovirga sp.]